MASNNNKPTVLSKKITAVNEFSGIHHSKQRTVNMLMVLNRLILPISKKGANLPKEMTDHLYTHITEPKKNLSIFDNGALYRYECNFTSPLNIGTKYYWEDIFHTTRKLVLLTQSEIIHYNQNRELSAATRSNYQYRRVVSNDDLNFITRVDLTAIRHVRLPIGLPLNTEKLFAGTEINPNKTTESVLIETKIETLQFKCFYRCHKLQQVYLPTTLKQIDTGAFAHCALKKIALPKKLEILRGFVFYSSLLKHIKLPKKIKQIGTGCFKWCKLKTIIFLGGTPDLTIIPRQCFDGCDKLTSITLPDSIITVEESAFQLCCELIKIHIPQNVTCIKNLAFHGCDELTTVTFDVESKLETIGNLCFNLCKKLTGIVLPTSLTMIHNSAFQLCDAITEIHIPQKINILCDRTFSFCDNLTTVTFDDNSQLTKIDRYCFSTCKKLVNIILPNDNITIHETAFLECDSLGNFLTTTTGKNIKIKF